jgi:hypothetical protein
MGRRRGANLTEQGEKEQEEINDMVRRCGDLFQMMEHRFANFSRKQMIAKAHELATTKWVQNISRLCGRHKRGMICWFVFNDADELVRADSPISAVHRPSSDSTATATSTATLATTATATAILPGSVQPAASVNSCDPWCISQQIQIIQAYDDAMSEFDIFDEDGF